MKRHHPWAAAGGVAAVLHLRCAMLSPLSPPLAILLFTYSSRSSLARWFECRRSCWRTAGHAARLAPVQAAPSSSCAPHHATRPSRLNSPTICSGIRPRRRASGSPLQ